MEEPEATAATPTEGGRGTQPFCKDCAEMRRRSLGRWRQQREKDMEFNPFAKIAHRRRDAEAFGADRRRTWN